MGTVSRLHVPPRSVGAAHCLAPDPARPGADGARGAPSGAADDGILWRTSQLKALSTAIEGEIIPRLLLVHRDRAGAAVPAASGRPVTAAEVSEFADLLLTAPAERYIAFADQILADGVPLDMLLLGLFAPTARQLGVFWTEDVRSFTDVTIALGGLQRVLRHVSAGLDGDEVAAPPRRALLVPAPGEQHNFGLFMVEMFLHRAGWHVDALPLYDAAEMQGRLRSAPVDLVGVSCSCERFVGPLGEAVRLVRDVAGRDTAVMGGGNAFAEAPHLGRELGIDAVAGDAAEAVDAAARLVPPPAAAERRDRLP